MEEFSRLSELVPEPIEPAADHTFSARELEILNLVATGASNKEIASNLVIAEGTVKNHLTNILSKLGRERSSAGSTKSKGIGHMERTKETKTG
jgi:DNA-binding NarL/FixJ family response regulator